MNSYKTLMEGRLGIYNKNKKENPLDGVVTQEALLEYRGGNLQQDRMIKDKRRSLDRAVWNSYQGAKIKKVGDENISPICALINPNKLKQDYDEKILSVGYEYNISIGSIIEWLETNTYWLVYLQDLTELAYFKGNIRKCSYQINWKVQDNFFSTYAAVIGPEDSKIPTSLKHEISMDIPNYTISLIVPNNIMTLDYFKRYQKFYLKDNNICWVVQAVDAISTPGIIEIYAVEDYANKTEDDIKNGIVQGLIPDIPEASEDLIQGENVIKVKQEYEYIFTGKENGVWTIDDIKAPIVLTIDSKDTKKVKIKWNSFYSGQFNLCYNQHKKLIQSRSLFH